MPTIPPEAMKRVGGGLLAIALLAATPRSARAGGLELLPGGTRSVGRAGAVAARPEDAMVLIHNPAGLALLSSEQVMLNLDVAAHDMCVDPYGYYGWGVYQPGTTEFGDQLSLDDSDGEPYATTPLPEVCNSAPVLPFPQMAWAAKITDDLGIGVGFVFPTVVPGLQWGGDDGTISVGGRTLPTPTRYQLIKQEALFGLAPSLGVGYRVLPWLSVGANVQIASLRARTTAVQAVVAGTQPSTDALVTLDAEDYFVPAVTLSVHAQPMDELDVMIAYRHVDRFDGSGDVTIETRTYRRGATEGPIPFENDPIELVDIEVGLPYTLSGGVRYSGELPQGGHDGPGDPMDTELWDVELDWAYYFNEQASQTAVQVDEAITVIEREVGGGGDSASVPLEELSQVELDRRSIDSWVARLGGSYSVLPRSVAVHGGVFYESRGVDPAYVNIDSFALARVGVGLGLMWRVGGLDLTAGYGHIFQETLEVAPPPHQPVEDTDPDEVTSGFDQRVGGEFRGGVRQGGMLLEDPDAPDPSSADAVARLQQQAGASSTAKPERIINAGKYTAAFDIFSVGVTYHFD
ncbi:MAG: hypothetical protein PVI30_11120 [Myxococcales bacterium]|jgi:hypothetical protein